jgi:acetoacetyl-CoA synthetase
VVPSAGHTLDHELIGRIRDALRSRLSPRHVPDEIRAVSSVPRTLSGKKLEVPIKKILTGTPPAAAVNLGTLANPESIAELLAAAREGGE